MGRRRETQGEDWGGRECGRCRLANEACRHGAEDGGVRASQLDTSSLDGPTDMTLGGRKIGAVLGGRRRGITGPSDEGGETACLSAVQAMQATQQALPSTSGGPWWAKEHPPPP